MRKCSWMKTDISQPLSASGWSLRVLTRDGKRVGTQLVLVEKEMEIPFFISFGETVEKKTTSITTGYFRFHDNQGIGRKRKRW